MTKALQVFIALVALLQASIIGVIAFAALNGDDWGIARAVAMLLAVPFVVFTGPALILMMRGRVRLAALLVVFSALLVWVAWWTA